MSRILHAFLLIILTSYPLYAAEGLIHVKSDYGVNETSIRLESSLKNKGMTIFTHVKHSDAAQAIGVKLRDTELIIFGNPKIGSLLMQCDQKVAIDLPQKALVWADQEGVVRITYNDPDYLQRRHNIQGCDAVLDKIGKALAAMVKAAAERK
jgi:uncharacterized protein (DUF302 family)